MAASADPAKVSPKVRAVGLSTVLTSLLVTVVGALATWAAGVTPDQLPQLGVWAVPVIMLVTGLINTAAGYLKGDPLRQDNALKLNTPQIVQGGTSIYVKDPKLTPEQIAQIADRFKGNAG